MFHRDLLSENEAAVQRFLSSNYFASENLVVDTTTSSLTWERVHAGFAPVGMLAFVNNAVTSATRRSTMASCDTVISTLDDAVKALASDTSSAYARLERELVGDQLLVDAEVLETLTPRTKERGDEYVGLKHATYRSAVNLGMGLHGEDYIMIETNGRDVDPDGFAFAFKMLRSVDVPGVFSHVDKLSATNRRSLLGSGSDLDSSPRRGNIHTFMIILSETKYTGLLRMQVWLDVDLPSNGNGIPVPLSSSFSSLHDALSLGLRYRRVLERSFSASVKKNPATAVSIYAAVNLTPMSRLRVTQCQVCERKLGLLARKRYSCDVCKASLCGTCARTTDMCSWRICGCCYARNHSLFSRQIMSKLTSPFSRLSFFARRSSIAYRQSIVNALPVRHRKSYGQPMAATITPFEPASMDHDHDKDSRRTSSSDSSSSTTVSRSSNPLASSSSNSFSINSSNSFSVNSSNPLSSSCSNPFSSSSHNPFSSSSSNPFARNSINAVHASSSDLNQITELDDDYVPGTSYTDGMPLSLHGGVKLLDDTLLHRLSMNSSQWDDEDSEEDIDNLDVDRFLERMSIDEGNEPGIRESYTGGRISFHHVL